ncbi:MAG: (d)CMP kinase [Granulosicoccaceae bacterium]
MTTGEQFIPVVTIDGPSGAGKGAVALKLARKLGYHLLDSGAIYRAAAVHALNCQANLQDQNAVLATFESFAPRFEPGNLDIGVQVWLNEQNITNDLRTENTASAASMIASLPAVRQALLASQRDFQRPPGLVADGRDMGTVVFPNAQLKVFLTASAQERAQRRSKQLKEQGITTTMQRLTQEIRERDTRDSTRSHAPLVAADDAITIDSSALSIEQVVSTILGEVSKRIANDTGSPFS